ncbi:MAG: ABC transporter ATP-binding protein/permease, partial [Ruminiclostridium sp.]|nr:ABC transporter ATP-binding protein/permease [Ruminiclostridium sp.]
NCLPLPTAPREIELKNVSFGYNQREGYILRNINIKIDPCNKIAIVGYNGARKNNLIKLIMRLYDPNEGEILLNDVNIKDYDLKEYRRKIGTVFQDFKIFAATINENVLLDFEETGKNSDLIFAIEKSGFKEKLDALSEGLSTAENKSVIFISHRLSTTRTADRIYMLEKGRIIEEGSHSELLERGGKYVQMWKAQAGQYR